MSTYLSTLDSYEEDYCATFRDCPELPRRKRGYSPRHENRRGKSGNDWDGAHRRRNKRGGL